MKATLNKIPLDEIHIKARLKELYPVVSVSLPKKEAQEVDLDEEFNHIEKVEEYSFLRNQLINLFQYKCFEKYEQINLPPLTNKESDAKGKSKKKSVKK